MQSIPEEYTPPGKTRADIVDEIFLLANTVVKNTADGQPVYKIPGLIKYYDIITYWDIRNVSGQKLTSASPVVAGPTITTALGTTRTQYLYNFTLQNCALGTVTQGTKVDTKVQILQYLTDAPTGNTDVTGNYIQTIYNLLLPASSTNPVPYKNTNAADTSSYIIPFTPLTAPVGFVGTFNAPLTALRAMAPPGKLTPALLKKLNLGASALLGSGYSLPNLKDLYGDVNSTDANNMDSIIVTLLDAISSPYDDMKYDSTGNTNYNATYISTNFTVTSFADVFSKVKTNYPSFTSFTKTVFWKTILPALVSSNVASNVALARSIMKLIDGAFSFTTNNPLKDRLSWFGIYGTGTSTTQVVSQSAYYQLYANPTATPSKSTLAQALFMVVSTDKQDDIFACLTASDSTVNTDWIGTQYTASSVSGVSALTPKNFNLSLFNAAISFIGQSTITPFDDITAIQIKKTDLLLGYLASGFLDNIIPYNVAVLNNSDQTAVTRIISLTSLAITSVNKIDVKTSPTETGITVANISVTLTEYFTFLDSLFGKNLKVYQDSLLKLLVDNSSSSTTTSAINSQIAFFIDRASNATIADSTTVMWNTKPIVAPGAQVNTGKSYFGTDVHQNLINYAFNTSTVSETDSVRAVMINTIMALITSDVDKIKFFNSLTSSAGTTLLRKTMFDNPLLDQTLLAGLINSVVIYSYVGMLMTKSKTGVVPIIPQSTYTATVLGRTGSTQGVTPVPAVTGSLGTVDTWLSTLKTILFPAYSATTSAVTASAPYLTTTYESVFHTTNMAKFYGSLSDMAVNVILRPLVTSSVTLPIANSDFTAAGSWMNYFNSSVNIAQSIAGFDSFNPSDSYEPNLPGYPLTNIFNTNMLFQTFSFDFSNGRQTSPNAIYVQVVSGYRSTKLGYDSIRVNALLGNIQ